MFSKGVDFWTRVRAARGAQLLDRVVPGWAHKIDLDNFSMADTCQCALAQTHGTYLVGFRVLKEKGVVKGSAFPTVRGDAIRYGFNMSWLGYAFGGGRLLTRTWLREINRRRTAAATAS